MFNDRFVVVMKADRRAPVSSKFFAADEKTAAIEYAYDDCCLGCAVKVFDRLTGRLLMRKKGDWRY